MAKVYYLIIITAAKGLDNVANTSVIRAHKPRVNNKIS